MKIAKHYIEECEKYPDIFAFDITAKDPGDAAYRVSLLAAARFDFTAPLVLWRPDRKQTCTCTNQLDKGQPTRLCSRITLCADFNAGQLLHELAHARCFYRYGEHDHGRLFQCAMHDICFWFRLDEEAQGWLFP